MRQCYAGREGNGRMVTGIMIGSNRLVAAVMTAMLMLALAACSERIGDTGVKGVAVLEDGTGAGGAAVMVYGSPDTDGEPVAAGRTDQDGNFSVALPRGTYYMSVELEMPDGEPLVSSIPPEPFTVTSGIAWAGEVELEQKSSWGKLTPGTGVTGSVIYAGSPVEGAGVYLYRNPDAVKLGRLGRERAKTGPDGWFTVNIRPGKYYVAVRKPSGAAEPGGPSQPELCGEYTGGPVTVRDGEYTSTGEIALAGTDAGKTDGTVTGASEHGFLCQTSQLHKETTK